MFVRKSISAFFSKRVFNSCLYHLYFYKIFSVNISKINLGSGSIRIKNFKSIDAHPFATSDIIGGIKKIKLKSDSVNIIYNSHVLEHVGRLKTFSVLKEWHRILRPGGSLYISVPNVEVLYKMYLDNINEYHDPNKRKLIDMIVGIIHGGQNYRLNVHYNGFSFITLEHLLVAIGFEKVELFDPEKVSFLNDVKDGSKIIFNNKVLSLNIKAVKK